MIKKVLLLSALACGFMANEAYSSTINVVNKESKLASKNGAFSGRVVSENKEALPGAVVSISDLNMTTITDAKGYFYISNVPAGEHTITVQYIGYEDVKSIVKFEPSTVCDAQIEVAGGIELGEIEVKGIVSGRRKAIQQQKSEVGVSNVISADQMERFPDENIGDAMKRIPGINVQYDQGEARFGQIRGTSPDLSSVTVNGNRTPSAEGGTRSAQLDLIPADMIETVEVRKVVTADMDGDAIGGAVNLVTKSAPAHDVLNATIGTGYNPISQKATFNGSVTAGSRFFNDKLGVVGAISYMNTPAGSDNIEAEWDIDDNGNEYMKEFQNRQYFVHRERQSYSLSTDYKINANNKIEFKGMYNRRNDWENRYRLKMKLDEPDSDGNTKAKVSRETKGGGEDERYTRLERQETQSYNLSGEHNVSRLEFDWNVDYSIATEVRPNERYMTYEFKKMPVNVNTTNESQPKVTAITATDMDIESFKFDKIEESFEDTRENEFKAAANFKINMASGNFGNSLRFGYKLQNKVKSKTITYNDIEPTSGYETEFLTAASNNFQNQTRDNYMAGDYKVGSFVTREFLGKLDLNNSANFSKESNLTEEAGSYNGRESINAAYLRFDQKLGSKVDFIAGVRMESTYSKYKGFDTEIGGGSEKCERVTFDTTKINVLPSFLLKYTPREDMILRASFTSTIARPKFSDLIPGLVFDYNEEEIIEGNPLIENTVSNNVDLMFEYYTKDAGIISAGIYYKDINNFIVESSNKEEVIDGTDTLSFKRKQAVNGGNGRIFGVEAALQRDLSFISPALKNFGVYANYTYNYSKVTELTSSRLSGQSVDEMSLPGSPEHTLNASLYYENRILSAAVAYNFASAFLDEMGGSAYENRYYDKVNYLDFNLSVKATDWLTVYGEVNNILNQPLRYYQGDGRSERVMQVEYYGVKTSIGLKARF